MSDWPSIVAGCVAGIAAFLFCVAVIGRPDPSRPRCKNCRRDARPFAWREPRACECGALLEKAGTVRVGRRRSKSLGIVAMMLAFVALALAWNGVRLVARGGDWSDAVPARIFGWQLSRGENDWISTYSLARRLREGLSRDDARELLDAYVAGPQSAPFWGSDARFEIVDRLVGMALPEGDLAARAMSALTGDSAYGWIDATEPGLIHVTTGPLALRAFIGGVVLRIDEVRVDGAPVAFRIADEARVSPDGWCRSGQRLTLDVSGWPGDSPQSLEVRALACRLPCPVEVWADDVARSGETELSKWGIDLVTAPVTLTVPVMSTEIPVSKYESNASLRTVADLGGDIGVAWAAVAAPVLGGVLAGIIFALTLLFGIAAARGWLALERPRCRGCGATQRSRDDALPERCTECGAELSGPRALRWIAGRRSAASIFVTLPLVFLGGLALAIVVGAVAARDGWPILSASLAQPERSITSIFDAWMRGDDTDRRLAASVALRNLAANRWNDGTTKGAARRRAQTAARCMSELAEGPAAVRMSERTNQLSEVCVVAIVESLRHMEEIDSTTAERWLQRLTGPPNVNLAPVIVRPNEVVNVGFVSYAHRPIAARIARRDDERHVETWVLEGEPLTFIAPEAPGIHEVSVEWKGFLSDARPLLANDDRETIHGEPCSRGQLTRRVYVLGPNESDSSLAIDDEAMDPFAQSGSEINVRVAPCGERAVVTLSFNGPNCSLAGRGARGTWEVRLGGAWQRLRTWLTSLGAGGIVAIDATLPEAVSVRWMPTGASDDATLDDGKRIGATWTRTTEIECSREGTTRRHGDRPATLYRWQSKSP